MIRSVRIQSHAFQAGEHRCDVSDNDEQNPNGVLG